MIWVFIVIAAALALMTLCCSMVSSKISQLEEENRKWCELCGAWEKCRGEDKSCPWRGEW